MRVLLDTNIIIHRENKRVSNYSIGLLYRWIDRLKYDKVIHPLTIYELRKYKDPETQEVIEVKLESYEVIKTTLNPDNDFLYKLGQLEKSENDHIDNCLLYELYRSRVDIFITEDRRLRNKAKSLGLGDKTFSINSFITKVTNEHPDLIEYKALSVEKVYMGYIDVNDAFFDSLRRSYDEFNKWFARKCDEEAYVCRSDNGNILGFLYIKTEEDSENYSDIEPVFLPKRRMKIGTFKVESTGFRLGERFIKIVFDNALRQRVDEIYVTFYQNQSELQALERLLTSWGFKYHGIKRHPDGNKESVYVKQLHCINPVFSVRENFPSFSHHGKKYIIPIAAKFHTSLLPDSQLTNENRIDFLGKEPHRYALQKVYISWSRSTNGIKPGDLILFYRMGLVGENKKYKSVLTTLAIAEDIIDSFESKKEYLSYCQNRSVFTPGELDDFWSKHKTDLKIIKFIYICSLSHKIQLGYLWENNIISFPNGPRPFTLLTDAQFDTILRDSETTVEYTD